MLTKEHLKYRVRAGRAHPTFLPRGDAQALAAGRDLIALFEESDGMTFGELEEAAEGAVSGSLASAFKKLLLDTCETAPEDDEVEARRWEALVAAERLRCAAEAPESVEDYQAKLASTLKRSIVDVQGTLYGDLPACRRVLGFRSTTPEALLDRYNLAQAQGLLLRARSLTIKLKDAKLATKRELFRQLKFHRLLCEVVRPGDDGVMELRVSGPLGIFDQAASYGLRLANFFPHVVHLPQWEVVAEVNVKKRDLSLKLDNKCGLVSHYKRHESYVPEELTAFVGAFNERMSGWRIAPAEAFVHIGRQSYCFPDLTITGQGGRRIHVELFHRWHAGQLLGRLDALEASPLKDLILGVSKTVAKNPEIGARLARSTWFAKNGFLFSEFPTPKALAALLSEA